MEMIYQNDKLKENIINDINDSKLPAFAVEAILKSLHEQVANIAQQQSEEAKKWKEEEELKKNKKEGVK